MPVTSSLRSEDNLSHIDGWGGGGSGVGIDDGWLGAPCTFAFGGVFRRGLRFLDLDGEKILKKDMLYRITRKRTIKIIAQMVCFL